ncbi:MAG TPA: hypothetical protein VEK79_01430 [Thermoanaerobaculia bacterium]|nr:hypothetical protein [Thermoanaerobaculia bacterium]
MARLADQVWRSIANTARTVSNAPTMPGNELRDLYRYDRGVSGEQRQPQPILDDPKVISEDAKNHEERRFARRENSGLPLVFESGAVPNAFMPEVPNKPIDLASIGQRESDAVPRYATATIPLQRLINSVVTQTAGDVFDTVFILDGAGNVIYQWRPSDGRGE